ncbi:spindle pole body interacting protein [Thelephora terrestris]|uniref:Spindle pole body interacting protein n=1 Tax=Thelephora terrestris TaxID=56493 RepID=A0A9P6L9F2_9AGAM|nr:spindle pole body interacting protein [Thelephora terrestris]
MAGDPQHCSFVLLAEFDILRGAQLTYQFPQPLGTDEWLMANLMLPDGAEKHLEDWTIFFLNQTPFNTIAPVLALEKPEDGHGESTGKGGPESKPELLYVLNLVRTKQDKSLPRGALVKAMAICTRHPFIQIFKPVLLMALDDYFSNPSKECLSRLFDAVNSMDIAGAPVLTRHEKLIMRYSERKDVFAEKFRPQDSVPSTATVPSQPPPSKFGHGRDGSSDSKLSFEEGLLARARESRDKDDNASFIIDGGAPPSSHSPSPGGQPQPQTGTSLQGTNLGQYSPSDSSFSLGGSAVWVGEDGGGDHTMNGKEKEAMKIPPSISRNRTSVDASSTSSSNAHGSGVIPHLTLGDPLPGIKDTRFFPTMIVYKGHQLPIKIPLSTFPEEVGDYSLIQLIQTFSTPTVTVTGPHHPHLHTNGSLTHPIIILFNALITGKRIVFLGHGRPAGQVASYVLSACSLGSGCGSVLRGFVERAFPYAHLTNREEWESIPGYIAGVTNLIFESSKSWDLLCDVGTGRMVVSKDISTTYPYSPPPTLAPHLTNRGTLKAESSVGSEEEFGKLRSDHSSSRSEHYDNMFMEDIVSAISYHFGESLVRARFTDYVWRFLRLAARYDEEVSGSTTSGWPTAGYTDRGERPRLGSGLAVFDDLAGVRELQANASRIEGWKQTRMCQYWDIDFKKSLTTDAIQGVDIYHQLSRLRHGKNIPDAEVELMMRTFAENLQTYDQVVELLALVPPHQGGLLPLSLGLLHPQEIIREYTVDILNELRQYSIGVLFLQSLNHFQRYAYVRLAAARKAKTVKEQNHIYSPPQHPHTAPLFALKTPSNRSESSLGGG